MVAALKDSFHRGVVMNMDETRCYEVYFSDIGVISTTKMCSVDRPAEFWECPNLAVPCVIAGWQKMSAEKSYTVAQVLKHYMLSKTVLNDVKFILAPKNQINVREFITSLKTDQLPKNSFTLNVPDIQNLVDEPDL